MPSIVRWANVVAELLVPAGPGTYVETEATFTHNVTHVWNHGLGEIVTPHSYTLQAIKRG